MDGDEKGLVKFNNHPMISYAVRALAPLCDAVTISCNHKFDDYQRILESERVSVHRSTASIAANTDGIISDSVENIAGPVAGILSFLSSVETTPHTQLESVYCIVCSCDMPLVTTIEIEHLIESALTEKASVTHFKNPSDSQKDFYFPVVLDLKRAIRACEDWLESPSNNSKKHSVKNWLSTVGAGRINRIHSRSQNPAIVFSSANSRQDLRRLEAAYKLNSAR